MIPVTTITEDRRIQVLDRLYSFSDFEKRRKMPYTPKHYNLDNIRKIMDRLGNPQNHFRCFHVAGTKGKGTTTHLLATLLEEMGYRTGHTLSPQLLDERDRFYLRGRKVTWEEVIPILEEVINVIGNDLIPTVFDIFTAVAFQLFHHHKIEIVVVETGLGGRWDSTNCLHSSTLIACLITVIDYDHMDKLGHTLPLIAAEKAGIIKPQVPVFTLNTDPDVVEVIRKQAEIQKAPFYALGTSDDPFEQVVANAPTLIPESTRANLELAIRCLTTLNYPLTKEHILKTLEQLPIPGRYHKVDNLLIDGAHTPLSLRYLVSTIRLDLWAQKFKQIKVFFYCLYDKDVEGLVKEIPNEWEMYFFDCLLFYVDTQKVLEVKKKVDRERGQVLETVKSLFELNWREHPDTLHVFTGSFKLAGVILKELEKKRPVPAKV